MPRSPEPTRERLVDAALDLFGAHGYATTTVEEIADRAAVSARTFYRHFPDKEEVLFADDDRLLPGITGAITAEVDPVDAETLMLRVLGGLADLLEPDRVRLRRRQQIIDTEVALTGRELAKQTRWQVDIATALTARGFSPDAADMLAAIGFALFRRSLHAWIAQERGPSLRERIALALPRVRHVLDEVSTAGRVIVPASQSGTSAQT